MSIDGTLDLTLVIADLGPGGAQRGLGHLARGLAGRGHRVRVLTLAGEDIPQHESLPDTVAVERLDLLKPSTGAVQALANNLGRMRALRRRLLSPRPDAVISFVDITNVLAIAACLGSSVPVLVSERSDPDRHHIGRVWSSLRRLAYPRAAAVVAQTETAAARFRSLCACRTEVIANPVFRPEPATTGPGFGFVSVGRLSREKGHADLVRAYALLGPEAGGRTLTLVGDGLERAALEALAQELGVSDKVLFTGTVRDVSARLRAADVFILPSHYEGFPNALCEALAHGLAVVSTHTEFFPGDLVVQEQSGLLVAPGDVQSMARAMARLAASEEERARLGRAALETAERLDPERILDLWEGLIRRVLPR